MKGRAFKVKRPTQTAIRWSSEGIKSNQARTRRKSDFSTKKTSGIQPF